MKRIKTNKTVKIAAAVCALALASAPSLFAQDPAAPGRAATLGNTAKYSVGIGDILQIMVLQPETHALETTVSPDGYISFPYIGSVLAKDRTLDEIQQQIQTDLGDGYLRYPVVTVSLKESHSKNFFVYGEVNVPGSYPVSENMTVFRALSVAGGFTKFGSSSKVKVLRPKKEGPGYDLHKVEMKAILDGHTEADIAINPGDVVVVSEGVF